ncbi:MAG TPA: type II toxin-antitoxin system HicB family antitoxin [Nitrospirota bacterium]|nr:type II toxin-antitoxin system HicB family antitoxin [Nitrospirota bacterium]
MKYTIKAFIRRDGQGYIAECLEVEASVKGITLDETVDNLRHELCRCLHGAEMSDFGLVEEPTLFITFEDVPLPKLPLNCELDLPECAGDLCQ